MPLFTAIAVMLATASQSGPALPITVTGRRWAPFISPMGEPFRPGATGDDPFARWFRQADRDQDSVLTGAEMQADAERFFMILDSNHDGQIDPEELVVYESEIAPEVQVNSRWKLTAQASAEAKAGKRRGRADDDIDGYQMHGLQGAARYGLLNLPEPVAGADADFNRGTTRDEFQRAAIQRFQLLDRKQAGGLTLAELEARLPTRPEKGARIKRSKDAVDTRVGQPFPSGN